MDVGFLYETDMNVTWEEMCFSLIHLIKELVIKAHHTSCNLMEVFFFGFVTFTGKQNIFRH